MQIKYLRFTSERDSFNLRADMNPLSATLLIFFACHLAALAAPRVAIVRVRDIHTTVPSSLQEYIKDEQEAIKGNERVGKLNKLFEELKILQAQLEEESNKTRPGEASDLADETENFQETEKIKEPADPKKADESKKPKQVNIRELARNYEMKRQEAETLRNDFEAFKIEREKALKKKMVTSTRATLDRIMETSQKVAIEKGFDILIDSSGNSNTGVPFILYSKNVTDLTEDVQAALKASQPAAAAPAPAAAPATKP